MAFTSEQEQAIYRSGGNIIVSAAAGSGKTAVLTERIITKLKNGGSLDRLLVVTFTNLAAIEMKERIRKSLIANNLDDQLLLIDNAKIMTMDAFYNKILLENALSFNINPGFKLIDEVKYKILKKEAVKATIEEDMKEEFLKNFFNIKGISVGEDIIISFAEFLDKIPFNDSYINSMLSDFSKNHLGETVFGKSLYDDFSYVISSFITIYSEKIELVATDSEIGLKMLPFLETELSSIRFILDAINSLDYEQIKRSLNFTFERLPSIKGSGENPTMMEIKEIRSILKDEVKKYVNLFSNTEEEVMNNIKKQRDIIILMLDYVKTYRDLLSNLKEEYMTFDDIANTVLGMLVADYNYETDILTKTPLAELISSEFDEILIDEYQDTNMMQDLIFRAIENDNLFVVGDIKQSIYAFRGSEPDIMVKVKESYFLDKFPMLITLSKNFRSRSEILDFTNYVFEKIMSKKFGSLDYNESEFLYLGASYNDDSSNKIKITVINEDKEDEKDDVKKDIKEASLVASQIKKLILNGESPSDIAILIRDANSKAEYYRNALVNEGISVYTSSTKRYFDQYEVKLVIAILKSIIDGDRISLVAVLRSPLFNFNEEVILKNSDCLENLISDYLTDFREKSKSMPLDLFINYIYVKLDVINNITKLKNGEERFKNLLEMLRHAKKFISISSDLADFVEYLSDLLKNDLTLEGANPAPSDSSVLITSIHKSKGLQFKHVFMPSLSKSFNKNDLKEEIMFDKKHYVALDIKSSINSLNKEVIKSSKSKKMLEEEMRILYVGLTRACEYLYLSFTTTNFYSRVERVLNLTNKEINYLYLRDATSYMDFLLPVILKSKSASDIVKNTMSYSKFDSISPKFVIDIVKLNEIEVKDNAVFNKQFDDVIYKNLEIPRVFEKTNIMKSTSVTALKGVSRSVPRCVRRNVGFETGTSYHKILEDIPFVLYGSELDDLIKSMNSDINASKLIPFFRSDMYLEILNSKIYKEEEISFVSDNSVIDGVIDLLCEFDDKIYIIDYKSDIASEDELISRYKKQLDLYQEALKTNKRVEKYIYSIHNAKFIKL